MKALLWQKRVWLMWVLKACVVHVVVVGGVGFPGGDGWEWMSGAAQLDGAEFMDFASPLVQMSANAYRYPGTLRSIPGWSLSTQIAPLHPSQGGAHALLFEEDDAHRLILAFRGTQFSSSLDSVADQCADKLLWDGLDFGSLPSECSVFGDPHTLDYFSQALNYTLQVINLYPSTPILLTGHSLGAGLAVLVAGALSHTLTLHVIGFSAPATRNALLDRGLSVESLEIGKILVIAHEWDAIMRTQMEGQVGLLCFYPQTEPSSCKACIPSSGFLSVDAHQGFTSLAHGVPSEIHGLVDGHVKPRDLGPFPPGDCMDCFLSTHYLKKLIAVVDLGIKPECEQARDVSFTKLDIM